MSYNIAQIKDQARLAGKSITDEGAQWILNNTAGGDEQYVQQYLKTGIGAPGSTFGFDYAGAATQAYGDLGAYYDRILSESRGDLNKALARLVEDYNQGVRFKTQDTNQSVQNIERGVRDNALSRGLYQTSNYQAPQQPTAAAPFAAQGIPGEQYQRAVDPVNQALARYKETATTNLNRQQTDLPEQQARKEFQLEQERRQQAADLANTKGQQAYTQFQSQLF